MKIKKLIPILLFVLVLFGCEKEGNLQFINRTGQNVYYRFMGESENRILPGNTTKSYTFSLGKQTLFDTPEKVVFISYIDGETFSLEDHLTSTSVTIKPDKTLKLYCDPVYAGMKIFNNSSVGIIKIQRIKYLPGSVPLTSDLMMSNLIVPGTSRYFRFEGTPNAPGYYNQFVIYTDDNQMFTYGDATTVLPVGQQYQIDFQAGK